MQKSVVKITGHSSGNLCALVNHNMSSHEKTNMVSEQVGHKPSYTNSEDG